jgi:uncharacterized repeat protein (TIGR02543 family)
MKKLTFWKSLFLLFALIVGTSTSWADDVTLTASSGFQSASSGYSSDHTFSVGGIGFKDNGVMYNTKNSPSGFAVKQIIQLRKSSNGAGEIYNTSEISTITSVEITLRSNTTGLTVYCGTTQAPSTNGIASTSLTPTTVSFSYKDNNDNSTSATFYKYTFDLSSYKATYIRILNGSSANYVGSIVINYSSGPTTYSVTYNGNGSTSGSVPEDDNAYEENDEVTVLGNTGSLAKSGYAFGGWNTQADGNGTNYTAGDKFNITSDVKLYAKWNAKTITGLTCEGTPTKTTYNAGESFDPTGLTVTATFDDSSSDDVTASVSWTPNPLTEGTTSVTGTYMGETVNVSGLTVNAAPGSETNPFTVAEALAYIAAMTGEGDDLVSENNYYTRAIVSQVGDLESGTLHYYISDDGTTTNHFQVFAGFYLDHADFTNSNILQVGDEVVVCGKLENYSGTPYYYDNSYLTYFKRRLSADLAFGGETDKSVTLTKGDDLTGVGFTKADGINLSDITFSASYNDVASVNSSGVITLGGNTGTSVITATFAGNEDYKEGKATCTITVNPSEVVVEPEAGGYYQKVMSNDDLATGKYLIVYESGNVAFKSSLTTLDAANNNFAVTISDNKIAVSDQTTANEVTIDVTNNSIKAANGNYIGRTNGTSNGLYESTTPQAHTITVSNGAATIYCLGSNGTTKLYLKFNNDTNQKRFRYFTTAGTIQLYKLVAGDAPEQIDIQVSEAGFATYVSNFDLDYSTCDDLKAYIAKEVSGEIKFTEVEKVPANTGVLLRATDGGGKKYTVETTTETDDMTGNKLVRGTGAAVATGTNPYNYILNVVNNELGFYRANGQTVATNRAYLQTSVTPGALARIAIIFDDATTAINGIEEVAPVNVKTRKVVKNGRLVIETANGEFTIDGARVK